MKFSPSIISFLSVLLVTTSSYADLSALTSIFTDERKCQKLEWVKELGRTQGNGWVWFSGKGTAESLEKAYLIAEGMAVNRLIQECIIPHKEAKIHERCDQKVGEYYQAFARISLKDRQCKEAKYAIKKQQKFIVNKQLEMVHLRYLRLQGITHSNKINLTTEDHYQRGKYFYFVDKFDKAFLHFEIACKHRNTKACFNAGLVKYQQGSIGDAKGFFKMSCIEKNPTGCYFLGKSLVRLESMVRAKKAFYSGCDLKNGASCSEAARILYNQVKKEESLLYSIRACKLKIAKSCHNTGSILLKKKRKDEAKKYFKKACKMKFAPSCKKLQPRL